MNLSNLQILTWKEGEYYVSRCLNVEVSSFGKTRKEALENIKEALELYFEDAHEIGIVEQPELVDLPWSYA